MNEFPDWSEICPACFNKEFCTDGGAIFGNPEDFIGEPVHEIRIFCKDYIPKGSVLKGVTQ